VSEGPYALPANWAWSTIGELASFIGSGITPFGGRNVYVSKGVPFIRSQNVYSDGLHLDDVVFVTARMHAEMKRTHVKADDVLLNITGASIGRSTYVPTDFGEANVNQHVCIIRADGCIPGYLSRFLNSPPGQEQIFATQTGVTREGLNYGQIRRLKVPLAPLEEQRRIVQLVRELTGRNQEARTRLENVTPLIRELRHSILAKAFRGEITERDPNDEPAEKLLERIDRERGTKRDEYRKPLTPKEDLPKLPEGWCWATVDRLSRVVRGASPRPAGDPKLFGGTIPWITVGSLTADEQPYLQEFSQTLTEEGRERSRYVDKDTLLLTNSGATLGVPKITLIGGCINDGVAALLDVDYPTKLYLYYFLKSQTEPLRGINQGAAQPNLNTRIIKEIPVPICPLREQQRIVSKLENLLGRASQITTIVSQGAITCESLYRSILDKAFSGRLVPQDPNDEPAAVFLERIRVQRATTTKRGKHHLEESTSPATIAPEA
jgi:type I restriction enzyme S subunit